MGPASAGDPVPVDLLVAGGALDPQLQVVLRAAERRQLAVRALRVGPTQHPHLHWDLDEDVLVIDGEALAPRAVFLRHDVFAWLADPREAVADRARAWQDTLTGWLRVHPEVRWLNRNAPRGPGQKIADLHLARRCGLAIPRTALGNEPARVAVFAEVLPAGGVAKPVSGGQHCRSLADALAAAPRRAGALAAPALVQERVRGPDLRVYLLGGARLAYLLAARTLDVRDDPEVVPAPVDLPPALEARLARFQAAAALDLAAVDLKWPPGRDPVFLECNRQPMFAAFEAASEGALCDALLDALMRPEAPRGAG